MLKNKILAGAMVLIMPFTMCLTGCSFISMFNTFSYQYENASEYKPGDREIDEKVTKINLDYVSGDVTINTADTDKVSVKETANCSLKDPQKVHTWVNEGTLYVRFCQSLKKVNFTNIKKNLELTLPSSQDLDDVIVEISSGDLNMSGVATAGLNARLSSGDANLDIAGKKVQIKVSSGDIALTEKGENESVDINSSSGKVIVKQNGSCGSMNIRSSSGNVTADVDKISKMDISVSSGHIEVTGNEITELNSRSSSGHNTFELGSAPKTSTIKSSSGWVKVYLPENSDITINAKISSGSFNSELPFTKNGKEYTSGNGSSTMDIKVSSGNVDICKK